ncbi:hypothetical protein EDD53_1929 [Pacificibacter maritimus]|uniref:50S ribosomal protein L35 n=1 Tax=Pacificibacter maritimus TaxID=762213 RepID=A0A3N4UX95_9RHOB|nr:hypothetical protein [Pacificibacter maritimus]RPE66230.1 hypothetical protein EDD53_1929 [Pacificibacter maritimus]
MDADLFLVIGAVILVLSVPALFSAFSESRPPRTGAVMVLLGGGMVFWAITQHPGGYEFSDIPHALTRVIGRYF